MSRHTGSSVVYRPWLHRLALLTAVCTFPLVLSGGTVTTLRVGMVDREWPTPPWYMLAISWTQTAVERGYGFLIEHGHRQLGWIVGALTICLAVSLWRASGRRWLRWLGVVSLGAVSLQGVLGGVRVLLNDKPGLVVAPLLGTELAMLHGFLAQLVFCLLVAVALFTSKSWCETKAIEHSSAQRLQVLSLVTTQLIVVQLALGVVLRQVGMGVWVHILVGCAVAAHALMLWVRVRRAGLSLSMPALLLNVFIGLQIALGFIAWFAGAGVGTLDHVQVGLGRALSATAHMGLGALILATSTLLTLRSYRHLERPHAASTTEAPTLRSPLETA